MTHFVSVVSDVDNRKMRPIMTRLSPQNYKLTFTLGQTLSP